jgi:hypothetical protein
MTYNIERLETLHANLVLESKLGKHDQGSWGKITSWLGEKFNWPNNPEGRGGNWTAVSCPSTACAAGWTTIDAGAKMLFNVQDLEENGEVTAGHCVLPDGSIRDIELYAAELLGITDEDERNLLFSGSTNTEEVLAYIDEMLIAAKHDRTWFEQRQMQDAVR